MFHPQAIGRSLPASSVDILRSSKYTRYEVYQ